MQTYLVGGAVRDGLLGRSGADRDWVVVGATAEEMVAMGYQAVGRDFPVFLHPQTREEHALARTERKTAPGYQGFVVHAAPDVTLEEDLARRDLTINATTRPVVLDIDGPTQSVKDSRGREKIGASASTKINRKEFGIVWNELMETGGFALADEVTITLDIELLKK